MKKNELNIQSHISDIGGISDYYGDKIQLENIDAQLAANALMSYIEKDINEHLEQWLLIPQQDLVRYFNLAHELRVDDEEFTDFLVKKISINIEKILTTEFRNQLC